MLEFQSVCVGYNRKDILRELNLNFQPGFHVVLGANGAGKTTLFRAGVGILSPRSGHVRVLGYNPCRSVEVRRLIGYLPHRPTLYAHLRVRENLQFWAKVQGLSAHEFKERLSCVVDELMLSDLLNKQATTLSRGQSQRVSVARVLLNEPRVLFLDEPTTGLDPSAAHNLRSLLKGLARQERTIVYSTHNLYEATELADDVTLLAKGKVLDQGSVETLKERYIERPQIRFTLEGDPEPVFQKHGYTPRHEGKHWIVELHNLDEKASLVKELVKEGVSVLDVHDEVNPLEAIYEGLERELIDV
jgi:ABC-type multidrug transport system ATPase subunit